MGLPAEVRPARGGAARFKRARRLSQRERHSLGLQPHVGADDGDLTRARFYRALEMLIARETREANLRPLAKIGFDGRPPAAYVTTLENPGNEALTDREREELKGGYIAVRNTSSCPLDYFYHQSKSGIQFWEWISGKRFAHDWHVASGSSGLAQSLESLLLAKIAKPTREERKRDRLKPVTFKPRKGKRPRTGATDVMSDSRLDAMARLGRLCDSVSPVAWFLLVEIVGRERWAKDVALQLVETPEYVARRFRESLCEAAAHYRMAPSSRPRQR